jgi:hypothetical protein
MHFTLDRDRENLWYEYEGIWDITKEDIREVQLYIEYLKKFKTINKIMGVMFTEHLAIVLFWITAAFTRFKFYDQRISKSNCAFLSLHCVAFLSISLLMICLVGSSNC